MTNDAADPDTLVNLVFSHGTVSYLSDFSVQVSGRLWPRELKAVHEIIGIYKEQHKQSALSLNTETERKRDASNKTS